MTADRDTTRIVRSWLRTDEHESADRVLETVLARLDTTPQRRPLWPTRRFLQMNNLTRMAVAAAAVLVVAVLGYNVLPRTGGVGGPVAPTATPSPTPSPTPIPLNGQAKLEGRYLVGGLTSRVTITVPAGWRTDTDWVVIGPKGNYPPDGMAIRFYTVENVFRNPVSLADGVFDPPVGPAAADLASAIAGDPAWKATGPTSMTIGGRPALHLQFAVAERGSDGQFNMFSSNGDPDIWGFAPGQEFDLYVVDVPGERIVIDAFHYAGTSASDLAAQQGIIDSIQIDPAP
jgi:hypothetical protein